MTKNREPQQLSKGETYDARSLEFVDWTEGDGSSTEGYCCWDYLDQEGLYLGPDEHGIEPLFCIVRGRRRDDWVTGETEDD